MIHTPTMIEAPTVAWFSYRAGENAARPRTRLLAPKTRLRDLAEVYLPLRQKGQTWVYSRSGRIQALLSLHQRSSPTAWEVERLLLGHTCRDLCPELLDTLALEAGQHGAATLFLRLDADSPLVEAAQRAGFLCYQRETLLTARPPKRQTSELGGQYFLRLRREEDAHALFRLYNAAVPAPVRMAQGLTLDQWQGAAERCGGQAIELLMERDMAVLGWLKASQHGAAGWLDVMVHPTANEVYGALIDQGLRELPHQTTVSALVAHYAGDSVSLWQERGFAAAGEFVALARPVAAKIKEPALVPVGA